MCAREMEFGSLDGGDDDEHSVVGFVEISKLVGKLDAFFFGLALSDREYRHAMQLYVIFRVHYTSGTIGVMQSTAGVVDIPTISGGRTML